MPAFLHNWRPANQADTTKMMKNWRTNYLSERAARRLNGSMISVDFTFTSDRKDRRRTFAPQGGNQLCHFLIYKLNNDGGMERRCQ